MSIKLVNLALTDQDFLSFTDISQKIDRVLEDFIVWTLNALTLPGQLKNVSFCKLSIWNAETRFCVC